MSQKQPTIHPQPGPAVLSQTREQRSTRITLLGLAVNILLVIFKLLSGAVGHSGAIIADAFHSLSDLSTDIAVLLGVRAAGRPVDKSHDYGHGKIETLVSAFVGLMLLVVGGGILVHGCVVISSAIQGGPLPRPGWIALVAAACSIAVKEWLYQETLRVGRAIRSPAVIANAWHHRSDALSSIGVFLGIGGAILLGEPWRILDPLAAIVVSFFLVKIAVVIIRDTLNELAEASLSDEIERQILSEVVTIAGVQNPHNLKTRRIGKDIAIDLHIKVNPDLKIIAAHDIATAVERQLKERFGPGTFVSVHIEPAKQGDLAAGPVLPGDQGRGGG